MGLQRYERVSLLLIISFPSEESLSNQNQVYHTNIYLQVSGHDEEASPTSPSNESSHQIPASPPPSFRSHASSPTMRHTSPQATGLSEPDRTLADTFDAGGGSDEEDDTEGDDRQRLMRTSLSRHEFQSNTEHQSSRLERRVTELPAFVVPTTDSSRTRRGGAPFSSFGVSNDGVFANLDAKPELGEKAEEQPPVGISIQNSSPCDMLTSISFAVLRTGSSRRHTSILGDHDSCPRHGV